MREKERGMATWRWVQNKLQTEEKRMQESGVFSKIRRKKSNKVEAELMSDDLLTFLSSLHDKSFFWQTGRKPIDSSIKDGLF